MSRSTDAVVARQPLPRKMAIAKGWPFYVTGKRCMYGHASPRFVENRNCRECARLKETKRIKPKENTDRLKRWKQENADRERENSRIRSACRRAVDPQVSRDAVNKHRQANPEIHKRHSVARYTREKRQTPNWADQSKIREVYLEAQRLSEETGEPHHVDHIIPLKGKTITGLHVHNNLQVLPAIKNLRKGNSFNGDETIPCRN